MIKNIVFDVGKVLVSFEPELCLTQLGFDEKTKEAVRSAVFGNALWLEGDRGVLTKEELLQSYINNAPEYEKEIREVYEHVDLSIDVMPYAVKWMGDLKEKGFALYIISNYAENTFEKTVHKMDFLPYMDGAIFSYQHRMIKPDAEIYELLLEKYQLKASECVFLDDTMENVDAAKKAGYHAIQFLDYEQATKELEELLNER